jgi:hypothetical protein
VGLDADDPFFDQRMNSLTSTSIYLFANQDSSACEW